MHKQDFVATGLRVSVVAHVSFSEEWRARGVRNLVPQHRRQQVLIAVQQLYEAWCPRRYMRVSRGCCVRPSLLQRHALQKLPSNA